MAYKVEIPSESKTLKSFLTEILYLTFGFIFSIFSVIFLLACTPIYIFRQFVILLAKWLRPDFGEILNPLSSCFFQDLCSGKPPRDTILPIATFQGQMDDQIFRKRILEKWIEAKDPNTGILKYPKFQQYPFQWLGFPFFRNTPEPFDIKNHFFCYKNLGNNKNEGPVTLEQVDKFKEDLLNRSYAPERSPWEFHLVNNYRDERYPNQELSLLFLRIHHCLADGYSLLYAILGLWEHEISEKDLPTANFQKRSLSLREIFSWPIKALQEMSYINSQMFRHCPMRILNGDKAWHQYCAKSDLIPIERIKSIKNSYGVSFTSVLFAAISAALYRHLNEKSGGSKKTTQDKVFGMSVVPVPGHSKRLTNHVTSAYFDYPAKYFESPSDRLRSLEETMKSIRDSTIPLINRLFADAAGSMFAPITALLVRGNFVGMGLSNFPSIPGPVIVGEHTLLEMDFAAGALEGSAGLAITLLSYGQNVRFNVMAEKGRMTRDELADFIRSIEAEINELYKLCQMNLKSIDSSLHLTEIEYNGNEIKKEIEV